MAECLGEGVDPTKMCQSLVAKVAQSEQLQAVAAPEVLALFEDWMEEMEREVLKHVERSGQSAPMALADALGLSRSGASFMLGKLQNEGKL